MNVISYDRCGIKTPNRIASLSRICPNIHWDSLDILKSSILLLCLFHYFSFLFPQFFILYRLDIFSCKIARNRAISMVSFTFFC